MRFQTVTSAGTSPLSPRRKAPRFTRPALTARMRLKPTMKTMHPVQSASTLTGTKTASCLMAEIYAIAVFSAAIRRSLSSGLPTLMRSLDRSSGADHQRTRSPACLSAR